MSKQIIFQPQGVCSREVRVDYEGDIITHVQVIGGCMGNLQGISKLLEGRKIDEVIPLLKGIKCRGSRNGETSCPDQIACGLEKIER